jgi:Fe-S-cluster-containing dehydrogenase component
MSKRLVIDLDECTQCDQCGVRCGYFYRPDVEDHGVLGLRQLATFELVCRRCEEPSCIDSCVFDALERQANGVLTVHNLRCVGCKMCVHACPFGTIYPDMMPFYVTPCDQCLGGGTEEPLCVRTCGRGALAWREVAPDEAIVHVIDDRLAARSARWLKREGEP